LKLGSLRLQPCRNALLRGDSRLLSNRRNSWAEPRALTTSTGRDSMRRFPNDNSGQPRNGIPVAFPYLARSLRRWRWVLGACRRDLLWHRPLAGSGRPACKSQSDHRSQRRYAVASHRDCETLPARIRAGNLDYPFFGTRRDSGRDGHCLLRRGPLQQARSDSRRSAAGSDSRPRTSDREYRRRNQGRLGHPYARKGRSRNSCDDKSAHAARSPALAQACSWPGPGHRARRFRRSLRSPSLVAHHQ